MHELRRAPRQYESCASALRKVNQLGIGAQGWRLSTVLDIRSGLADPRANNDRDDPNCAHTASTSRSTVGPRVRTAFAGRLAEDRLDAVSAVQRVNSTRSRA